MIRFKAIFLRVLKEMFRDKRTLALMFIAPLVILTLMNVLFTSSSDVSVTIGVDQSVPTVITDNLKKTDHVKIKKYNTDTNISKKATEDNLSAFISVKNSTIKVSYENSDPSETTAVKTILSNVLTKDTIKEMTIELRQAALVTGQMYSVTSYSVNNSYIYGNSSTSFFDKIFPILMGFFVFFFVFLISGIALLKERTSGTLERILATPVRRSEIILGYLAGYGVFAILQTLLIVSFSLYILNIHVAGNIGWVFLSNILIAFSALVLGIFVSTFASSEFQMMQFLPIVVIPQIFFSGIISLDSMASWVKGLSYIFPLTYEADALSSVMLKGQGWSYIRFDLSILSVFIIVFTFVNIIGMKRYRKV
ncbi:ABC transporter permease [Enterococcus alishanensis]